MKLRKLFFSNPVGKLTTTKGSHYIKKKQLIFKRKSKRKTWSSFTFAAQQGAVKSRDISRVQSSQGGSQWFMTQAQSPKEKRSKKVEHLLYEQGSVASPICSKTDGLFLQFCSSLTRFRPSFDAILPNYFGVYWRNLDLVRKFCSIFIFKKSLISNFWVTL